MALAKLYILSHTSRKVHTEECPVAPRQTALKSRAYVEEVFPDYEDCKTCGGCGGL